MTDKEAYIPADEMQRLMKDPTFIKFQADIRDRISIYKEELNSPFRKTITLVPTPSELEPNKMSQVETLREIELKDIHRTQGCIQSLEWMLELPEKIVSIPSDEIEED